MRIVSLTFINLFVYLRSTRLNQSGDKISLDCSMGELQCLRGLRNIHIEPTKAGDGWNPVSTPLSKTR